MGGQVGRRGFEAMNDYDRPTFKEVEEFSKRYPELDFYCVWLQIDDHTFKLLPLLPSMGVPIFYDVNNGSIRKLDISQEEYQRSVSKFFEAEY